MNTQRVYFRLPVPLQEIALSAYGLRLKWLRYGSGQRRRLTALNESEGWSPARMEAYVRERLFDVLRYAAESVPFYRQQRPPLPHAADEAPYILHEWPLLSKNQVQDAGRTLLSDRADKAKLVEIHTGGTTGRALTVWCDRSALQSNYAFFDRFTRWAGIRGRDRTATFAGRPVVHPDRTEPPFWRRNFAARQLLCSSYHLSPATIGLYLDALARFRPALIDSYPSSLEPIARHAVEQGRFDVRPRAIITSSETLLPESRVLIEKAFSCSIFDHYGSAEMVALVTQCDRGRYHPNPEFGHLEILREDGAPAADGEEGEIVATGFINRVMPLIRYRTGDLAVASDEVCPCGRPFPVLDRIIGRLDDVVVTPDGRRVGRLDPIFKAVGALLEARVFQTELDHIRLELVAGPGFSSDDEAKLVQELRLRVGTGIAIEPVHVASIPRTGRGKLRTVVSRFSAASARDQALGRA